MAGFDDDHGNFWRVMFYLIVGGVLIVAAIKHGIEESDRQARIKCECRVSRHIAGQYIHTTGKHDGWTSAQTCYMCPDGIEECF